MAMATVMRAVIPISMYPLTGWPMPLEPFCLFCFFWRFHQRRPDSSSFLFLYSENQPAPDFPCFLYGFITVSLSGSRRDRIHTRRLDRSCVFGVSSLTESSPGSPGGLRPLHTARNRLIHKGGSGSGSSRFSNRSCPGSPIPSKQSTGSMISSPSPFIKYRQSRV